MPRKCTVCSHKEVKTINALIVQGISIRGIEGQFDIPNSNVQRHKENCIPHLFVKNEKQLRRGLLANIDRIRIEIEEVKALFFDNPQVRVQLIGKMMDVLEKEAKMFGAYNPGYEFESVLNKVAAAYKDWQEDHPDATLEDQIKWLHRFARGGDVDAAELAERVGLNDKQKNQPLLTN